MKLAIPDLSLVFLIGVSGSGKSTFARQHFKPTEILSSDFCRALVSDDENDQAATGDAFDVLHFIAAKRLAAGRLTVIDATNVQPQSRKPLVELARKYHCLPVAIVLNLPERMCQDRNRRRPDRAFGPHVIRNQMQSLRQSLRGLQREGFRRVFVLSSVEEVEAAEVVREPLWNNRKQDHGPFDLIGDVHGCFGELMALLRALGYDVSDAPPHASHPAGRKAIFVGDLVDRGPGIVPVLKLVMQMVQDGAALCVPGNHDMKLVRKLRGKDVQITHGLAESLEQLAQEPPEFSAQVANFLDGLVSHYVLDDGKLAVAHAGMKAEMQGRGSGTVRDFALYGETTGETDEFGLPVRLNWATDYRGSAAVVYGHTPVPQPEWLNNTINIDTGCVFGGRLTALRYPERELVSVPAARVYAEPVRPLANAATQPDTALTAQQRQDDVLDLDDVLGKRIINTRLQRSVIIREENAAAALEVMSRFAANPKWLIYLPPTMSPCETRRINHGEHREHGDQEEVLVPSVNSVSSVVNSSVQALLEHPAEAFAYFRHEGVPRVVCEQKHMGSRAVVIVCRDEDAARKRFGVTGEGIGIVYTRTGRRFFDNPVTESALLTRIRDAAGAAGLWDEFETDWLCLDCELMPWSAKAQELLRGQYAAVGAAARAALAETIQATSVPQAMTLHAESRQRLDMAAAFTEAYRRYCWPITSVEDYKLAPFHLLATEGAAHVAQDHVWHMQTLARLCQADPAILLATPYRLVDVTDPESIAAGEQWWLDLTAAGGEGMVVKPLDFITQGRRGWVQPAVKVRGREYLRIIYGPEYTTPENLERLRSRALSAKRSLALREFALGVEALERFARGEPLHRVHECVFGVLALESEPVDPRL